MSGIVVSIDSQEVELDMSCLHLQVDKEYSEDWCDEHFGFDTFLRKQR